MAINGNGNGSRFSSWLSSGLLGTIAWFVVLVIYCVFRAFGIEDPLLGQAFLLLTGAWVGNLTIAQGKKTAKTEEKVDKTEERVDKTEVKVEKLEQQRKTDHPEAAGESNE